MPNSRLIYLFEQYLAKSCTEAEKQELAVMILATKNDEDVKVLLLNSWETNEAGQDMPEERAIQILDSILHPVKHTKIRKMLNWRRVAAAAAIVIAIGGGSYYLFTRNTQQEIATLQPQEKRFKNDVAAPGKPKATITLSDGSTVALDSLSSGTLATQGNINVTKTADGKIIYSGASKEIAYNTLTNPRGSIVIDMTLGDGSHVWLNAGSSVTYPVAFTGNERKVEMTGEAYFEVVHNALKPFKVSIADGKQIVEVLGTHFNINSFDDEATIKTTLLQGVVKVTGAYRSVLIEPGEQAVVNKITNSTIDINKPDLEQVMAWKDGFFDCNGLNVESIMRQVARWYDVDINFKGSLPQDKFVGRIPRTATLVNVLKVLELNGVYFTIENKKITVL